MTLSEEQTRELIDEQLRKVGWEANTKEIRYSKGSRPTKGKNLAIAEWPTDSKTGTVGYAYSLHCPSNTEEILVYFLLASIIPTIFSPINNA